MTKAPTQGEMSKGQSDNTNNATKKSITYRLRTDLGRSAGVTMDTKVHHFTAYFLFVSSILYKKILENRVLYGTNGMYFDYRKCIHILVSSVAFSDL